MQFSNMLKALFVVVATIGATSAAPAAQALSNVQSNVAPYVGVADTNFGNTQRAVTGLINKATPRRRRRSSKSSSPAEYINSPESATAASCNVGTAQCCQSLHQTGDLSSQGTFGQLLAASVPLDQLMVGIQCSPIAGVVPIIGGSSSCKSQPVCCNGNKFDGLVSTGCSPVGLS